MPPKIVQVVSVGAVPLPVLKELEEPLQTQLAIGVILSKVSLGAPSYAFNKDRDQYHSIAIMRRLSPLMEPPANFVMGVVEGDLFEPDSEFIFGEADRESKTAIVSLARLRQGADLPRVARRLQVEALSHIGHLVGLSYCDDPRCFMFPSANLGDCDRKNLALCNSCRNELAKLNR